MIESSPLAGARELDGAHRREQHMRDLRFLETLEAALAGCRHVSDVYSAAVHRVAAAFNAASVCLAAYDPITGALDLVHQARSRFDWDMDLLMRAVADGRIVTHGCVMAVPVVHVGDGRTWGVLALARLPSEDAPAAPYIAAERQTLRAAAEHIAAELERRRIALLDDALDDLLRKAKPIDVYTHALREIRRFVRYDGSASVMTMQPGLAQLTVRVEKVVAVRGGAETLVDSPRRRRVLRLTAAQTRYLSRLQETIELSNDGGGWKVAVGGIDPDGAGLWRVLSLEGDGERGAILCFPLIFGGQMLGVLRLAAKRPHAFEPIDQFVGVLDRFARLLAVTLYRSELYYRSDHQLQAIKEMGRAITRPMSVEEICRQALRLALRVLHVQVGVVGLLVEDGVLELTAHQGCSLASLPSIRAGQGIAGTVVRTGRPWAVPDVKHEPAYVVFNSRVCSELVVPIVYDQEVIGFLDVESFEGGRFREEDEEVVTFLEALANQAAIAIKTAQLRSEAMERLGMAMTIDPKLSTAGLQDLLVGELRAKIDELAAANERLAAANRAKSQFLAQMSHDLRGPLNVIVGHASLLADPTVTGALTPERTRECLDLIRANGERLSALIGNILDLEAVEAGKAELAVAPLDAGAAFGHVRAVATMFAGESGKELEISVRVDPVVETMCVDEGKFLRIMDNLISNAIKFTPAGGRVAVTAVAETAADGGAYDLHVVVADTGIGIDDGDRERIFEPFQQVDTTVARQYHGAGLGLAVVRQLVDLHGGRVWLESAPGEGSAFHVLLPGAVITESAPATAANGAAVAGPGSHLASDRANRSLSVLVVEDIPAHMDVMRLAVTARGYTMHGAHSGEEALDWLAENRPDVILLDMQLPGIDGFDVAAQLKDCVETHAIPVIAVTADALSISEERALASGCDAFLTKPIDIARLLDTIDTVTA